ncbi:MAG: type VI secretion system-associated protein TagF [Zoogloea sp.]|nr:type VI secretion system-associated protein TagF [Zoogloea sp.]
MRVLPFNRTETQPEASYTLFGKLPNRPDFVRINHNHPAALEFDELIQRTFERSSARIDWLGCDVLPGAVDFLYVTRDYRHTMLGVLSPSFDQAGRRYPLVAAAILPSDSIDGFLPCSPIAYEVFFDGLRAQVTNAVENSVEALSCRQFLESEVRSHENACADFELAENIVQRFMATQPAARMGDLLATSLTAPVLQQALLNLIFYREFLQRFDNAATNQIISLPLSGNNGEQALIASAWLSMLSALCVGKGVRGGNWRGSYLVVRQSHDAARLVVSAGRIPEPFPLVMLGAAVDGSTQLDLANEHDAWKSHRMYAEVSYALGRLLADPACLLSTLCDFLGDISRQLEGSH